MLSKLDRVLVATAVEAAAETVEDGISSFVEEKKEYLEIRGPGEG